MDRDGLKTSFRKLRVDHYSHISQLVGFLVLTRLPACRTYAYVGQLERKTSDLG